MSQSSDSPSVPHPEPVANTHSPQGEDPFEEATASHSSEPTGADEEQPYPDPDDGSGA